MRQCFRVSSRLIVVLLVSIFLFFLVPVLAWRIKVLFATVACTFAYLEFRKPWFGVGLFLVSWSQLGLMQKLIDHLGPPHFDAVNSWNLLISGSLGVAIWLRRGLSVGLKSNAAQKDSKSSILSLSQLVLGLILGSALLATVILLFSSSDGDGVLASVRWCSPIVFGLLLFHDVEVGLDVPVKPLVVLFFLGLLWVGLETEMQLRTGLRLIDQGSAPGGPFETRNFLSPILVLGALACWPVGEGRALWVKAGMGLLAFALAGESLMIIARNGAVAGLGVVAVVGVAWLRDRVGKFKVLMIGFTVVLIVFGLTYLDFTQLENKSLFRLASAIYDLRQGAFRQAMGDRLEIWETAIRIWVTHPLGVGPGAFHSFIYPHSPYNMAAEKLGHYPSHTHNMPLQWLVEAGPVACIGWIVLWIMIPFRGTWKGGPSGGLAATVLMIGFSNILDEPWNAPGYPVMAVIMLVLMCADWVDKKPLLR